MAAADQEQVCWVASVPVAKELLQSLVCMFVHLSSPFMWFIHTLQTLVHVLCVNLEPHICYLKFVKPSASHVGHR